jgi:MFS family permease
MSRIAVEAETSGLAPKVFGEKGTDMRRWWPLVAICLGTFMLLVDVTIVNVALPSMARSLGSSFADLQWVIDGYALALAALLMVAGSLADRFGRRRLYLVGLIVFALASLACGLAPNTGVLSGWHRSYRSPAAWRSTGSVCCCCC